MNIDIKKTMRILGVIVLSLLTIFLLQLTFGKQIDTFIKAFNNVFTPLLIALFISYLLEPVLNIFKDKLKIKRKWLCVLLTMLVLVVFLGLFFYFFFNFIYTQIVMFIAEDLETIINSIIEYLKTSDLIEILQKYFNFEQMQPIIIDAISITINVISFISGLVINIVLIPVFLFFFLSDRSKIAKGVISVVPTKFRTHLYVIGKRSNTVVHSYFRGKLISMLFIFIYFSVAFSLIGLQKYALLFSLILTVLDLIPYVGPFFGIVVPMLYSLIIKDTLFFGIWMPVVIFIVNAIGQWLQNNIIVPVLIGKEMHINALLILLSMLFFGEILGIWGIILAIPLCGIIKVIFEYFKEERLKNIKIDQKLEEVIKTE